MIRTTLTRLRLLFTMALLGHVAGCTLSMPQIDSAIGFLATLNVSESDSVKESPSVWLASVGERGAVLNPYDTGSFVVFANADGDAIAFDGWTVRSITGFGFRNPLSISGKEGLRTFSVGLDQFAANCGPWELNEHIWSQACDNGEGLIELNDAGNIQRISISLGERLGNVTLWVVK